MDNISHKKLSDLEIETLAKIQAMIEKGEFTLAPTADHNDTWGSEGPDMKHLTQYSVAELRKRLSEANTAIEMEHYGLISKEKARSIILGAVK